MPSGGEWFEPKLRSFCAENEGLLVVAKVVECWRVIVVEMEVVN